MAVLKRPSSRQAPETAELLEALAESQGLASATVADPLAWESGLGLARGLEEAAGRLAGVDRLLRGTPGLRRLLDDPALARGIDERVTAVLEVLDGVEARLDASPALVPVGTHEAINSALSEARDVCWALRRDRLGMLEGVAKLLGPDANVARANLDGWWSIEVALAALDRLEVRGRDSAGIHVTVVGHGLDLEAPEVLDQVRARSDDPLFVSGSLRLHPRAVSFVYKAAAEIGELGDNVRRLRSAIASDHLLAQALSSEEARATVIAHTRWASVGVISEANAHPLNSEELGPHQGPYVVAALNGDVDNHLALRAAEGLRTPPEVTTDAKVIPAMVSRRLAAGADMDEAFRASVSLFEGSVAVAALAADDPDRLHLALAGSGQSLYVGLAEDAFVVASEPYGLVEQTSRYLRMDGESTRGQVLALSRAHAGELTGMTRRRYSGEPVAPDPDEVKTAEITTRDVDRKGFPHFLLKELSEAPSSLRKTLRGRLAETGGSRLEARVGPEVVPEALVEALSQGRIRKAVVIGQGTAAVAGQAVAEALRTCLPTMAVEATPATELSGFGLRDDMSDTLVVAVSQSGTTTDTNRTVDLVRARGAHVVSVVNRRNSDLAAKSHGVLYTSDGRDVEMSVASTKAFYAQVAAGWILAAALAKAAGVADPVLEVASSVLAALRELPASMEQLLSQRARIAEVAARVAPRRRYWAVVGSGPDRVAAAEARIKLSELCYRSISTDATEDKKHIDLSCEPLVIVCAASIFGPTADDVAKEVAIYRAHKAAPVVIARNGEEARFETLGVEVISVPAVEPSVAFVLSAMAGHLFGYEAALAIDAGARPLRQVRAALEAGPVAAPAVLLERAKPAMKGPAQEFLEGLRRGDYDGTLEASVALRVYGLLRYALGELPLEGYEAETGRLASPASLVEDLFGSLNSAIDELTRPVDAIRHQAKTVTVGISRSEDELFASKLTQAVLGAGVAPDALGYRALRTLKVLDPAVREVTGFTRYSLEMEVEPPLARVRDKGGVAMTMGSRTERDPRLRGSKHRAAVEREVTVVVGAADGRSVVLVPEVAASRVVGMTLLHASFEDLLPSEVARAVLEGYRNRYSALADAVTETEEAFDDSRLATVPILDLLTRPVWELALRWRGSTSQNWQTG